MTDEVGWPVFQLLDEGNHVGDMLGDCEI